MAERTKKRDAVRTIHGERAFENVAIQDLTPALATRALRLLHYKA